MLSDLTPPLLRFGDDSLYELGADAAPSIRGADDEGFDLHVFLVSLEPSESHDFPIHLGDPDPIRPHGFRIAVEEVLWVVAPNRRFVVELSK